MGRSEPSGARWRSCRTCGTRATCESGNRVFAAADLGKTAELTGSQAKLRGVARMEEDDARYQLVARATYLRKGYLVAAATYLLCVTVHQASVAAALR